LYSPILDIKEPVMPLFSMFGVFLIC
jgi:hypothetical protein